MPSLIRMSLILWAALLLGACQTAAPTLSEPPHRVIAYVRGRADIERIGADKLTHINYAFGLVSEEGEVVIGTDAPAHLARLGALKERNPSLKILLSVGGWGADHFSDAALTPESRIRFAASAVKILDHYHLDGIDLDWEYPGQPGPGIRFRPEDRENFTELLQTMREHLGSRLLTIASTGGRYFEHVEMHRIHRFLDWLNVMTYDFAGSWTKVTGHHTPLYRSASAPELPASADFIEQHLAAGIPPRKIVLGVAFYGRSWKGVSDANHGLFQPYQSYDVDVPYSRIVAEYLPSGVFRRMWDEAARAPYLWDRTNGRFVTYDDPESLREKVRYVREKGLGGIMYWEHSHDPEERLLDAIVSELQVPLARSPSSR